MEIKKLEALVETIKTKSINKAADNLGYTQSGLSYIINTVETEFGVQILKRTNRGIQLTEEGALLLPYIEAIIEKEVKLLHQIDLMKNQHPPVIRIGTFSSIAANWLPKVIESFNQRFPEVKLEIHTGILEITQWLEEGTIDIALLENGLAEGYSWKHIADDKMYVAFPSDSPLADQEEITLESLEDYTVILPSRNIKNAVVVELERKKLEYKNKIALATSDGSMLYSMVSQGCGVTFIAGMWRFNCPNGVTLRPLTPSIKRSLGIVVNKDSQNIPSVKCFTKHLISHKETQKHT